MLKNRWDLYKPKVDKPHLKFGGVWLMRWNSRKENVRKNLLRKMNIIYLSEEE